MRSKADRVIEEYIEAFFDLYKKPANVYRRGSWYYIRISPSQFAGMGFRSQRIEELSTELRRRKCESDKILDYEEVVRQ